MDMKRRNDRHSDPIPQSRTPETAMRGAEDFTNGAFKDLNRKPAEGWNCSAEVNKAFGELDRPLKYGASSSVTEHGKAAIPSEGGPDSNRSHGSIPNRHA